MRNMIIDKSGSFNIRLVQDDEVGIDGSKMNFLWKLENLSMDGQGSKLFNYLF